MVFAVRKTGPGPFQVRADGFGNREGDRLNGEGREHRERQRRFVAEVGEWPVRQIRGGGPRSQDRVCARERGEFTGQFTGAEPRRPRVDDRADQIARLQEKVQER